ncbi:hypothetical protein [Aminiphilus sp.]|uniref:hypothetical protein n=1 Tax=Aminiphilus sp. TaxID=1872488 RepID=UPI0034301898
MSWLHLVNVHVNISHVNTGKIPDSRPKPLLQKACDFQEVPLSPRKAHVNLDVEFFVAFSHVHIKDFYYLFRPFADFCGNLGYGFFLDMQFAPKTEGRPDDRFFTLMSVLVPENLESSDQFAGEVSPYLNMGNGDHMLLFLHPFLSGPAYLLSRCDILNMHDLVGKRQAQFPGDAHRHLLRGGDEHDATWTHCNEKIAYFPSMVGKLKKRTANSPNLIPFRLCAFPAGNLALADQKPIINDDVNPAIPCNKLCSLAFPRTGSPDESGHGKAGEQRSYVRSARCLPVSVFQRASSPFAMMRQTARFPREVRR